MMVTSPVGANRNQQKFGRAALERRFRGLRDPRGSSGIMSRGKNIYANGTFAAHSGGGPQFGRPVGSGDQNVLQSAIARRMGQRRRVMPYGR